ncbi:class I SAM-dependent methyltransferase [Halobacterium litoreum]|uniref:Class I SAM-dependent methyltransferase n=1 Tax=Halobacterium litoreum TaxID=2039234 RepID=A0ABD5NBA5_9EURY|nr:class I SAM-dependent methyltransferase [Halobacterium litoreum]UHH14637.1 methyltransferase domain-containing protein [Halobacterium litoreum]
MALGRNAKREQTENVAGYDSTDAVAAYAEWAAEDGLHESEERVLARYFRPSAGRVLDVGCGAGRTTAVLDRRGFDVTGVDVSAAMVREARRQFPGIGVQRGDATDLAFRDESFQYVLFSYCGLDLVYPEAARREALREIRRVLAPGGVFAFSTHNSWYNAVAAVDDWSHVRKFYLSNGNHRRLGERYKVDDTEWDMKVYVTNPVRQRRQLRRMGFEPVAYVGKRPSPLNYLERRPYYVARKPDRG